MRKALLFSLWVMLEPMLRAQAPTVSLSLPAGIDAVSAEIRYFITGDFGGYGGMVRTAQDQFSYEIEVSRDGKPANEISIVAYLPGCEFSAYKIDLRKEPAAWRQLECVPLPTITLRGQYSPVVSPEDRREILVWHDADWVNSFFGVADGFIPQWKIAVAKADELGRFSIELPNFCLQTNLGDASKVLQLNGRPFCEYLHLKFYLKDKKTNGEWELELADTGKKEFAVQHAYPDVVKFEVVPTIH